MRDGVFTHASVAVVRAGRPFAAASVPDGGERVFDVASLTKVATASLALALLDPDAPVAWLVGRPKVSDLLAHRSGLPAWRPYFAHAADALDVMLSDLVARADLQALAREIVRDLLANEPPVAARPTYSDAGFLALGLELERRFDKPLPELARAHLLGPLELRASTWGGQNPLAVPTGKGRPRAGNPPVDAALCEELRQPAAADAAVDDDNAAALGGGCGHAGLWSTAADLARLGDHLRATAAGAVSPLLKPERAALMFAAVAGTRTLGLDTPAKEGSALGSVLGRGPKGAAGHLGFTGCSLWMDRDAELTIAFVCDAVALARPSAAVKAFRPVLHDEIGRICGV